MVAIPELAVRGPLAGAVSALVAVSSFGFNSFFTGAHNTAVSCAKGSATGNSCVVDIMETVMGALMAGTGIIGAFALGLVAPTPRDLSHSPATFRVDGQAINWYHGMNNHKFGLNRTISNPAIVEFQHNETSPLHRYLTYQNDDGYLVHRHDTGLDIPDPSNKRALCRAYIDLVVYGDPLRPNQLSAPMPQDQIQAAASSLVAYLSNNQVNNGCLELEENTNGVFGRAAKVAIGGACAHSIPNPPNCAAADYDLEIANMVA